MINYIKFNVNIVQNILMNLENWNISNSNALGNRITLILGHKTNIKKMRLIILPHFTTVNVI